MHSAESREHHPGRCRGGLVLQAKAQPDGDAETETDADVERESVRLFKQIHSGQPTCPFKHCQEALVGYNDKVMEDDYSCGAEALQRLLWLPAQLQRLRCLCGGRMPGCVRCECVGAGDGSSLRTRRFRRWSLMRPRLELKVNRLWPCRRRLRSLRQSSKLLRKKDEAEKILTPWKSSWTEQ